MEKNKKRLLWGKRAEQKTGMILLGLFLFVSQALAVTVETSDYEKGSVRWIVEDEKVFISVSELTQILKGTLKWQTDKQTLVLKIDSFSLQVIAGNPFVIAGKKSFYCDPNPLQREGEIFVPVERWAQILSQTLLKVVVWNEEDSVFSVSTPANQITDLKISVSKPEETVVQIFTSESVHVSLQRHNSTFMLDFPNTSTSKSLDFKKKRGMIYSVETFQFPHSLQMSFLLDETVKEPVVQHQNKPFRTEIIFKKADKAESLKKEGAASKSSRLDKIKTVVVDAGHGGMDPGALGPNNMMEKDITLQVALLLKEKLLNSTKMKIILTRDQDEFIALGDRTKKANENRADLFLSIHCNSIGGTKTKKQVTRGFKAYINSLATRSEDKLVAIMENASVRFEGKEEESQQRNPTEGILGDILSNEFLRESEDWASMVVEEMSKKAPKAQKEHTGIGQAGFYVLNGAYMPAVLVEMAYISNPVESQLLKSKSFQKQIADALCSAVLRFKEKYDREEP
jgi:N-acetylmuramoyl-L-alanine amidase